jgi:hypothetical protein
MAKSKEKSEEQTSDAAAGLLSPGKRGNKTAAVRQALAKLGRDALPADIRDFVKNNFNIVMSLNHISNIKSHLNKKRKKPGPKPGSRKQAVVELVVEPRTSNGITARRSVSGAGSFSLDDIEAAKDLAQRVGVAQLHQLIDIVAR